MRWHIARWYLLAALIVALDQGAKYLALHGLDYGEPVTLLPVLDLTLQYNPGAAFSFLSDASGWQRWFFILIAVSISALLVVWISRVGRSDRLLSASLACILGGAIGNVIDRLHLGHVVDFISVHWWSQAYFPAFNVADSSITVGAALMLLDMVLQRDTPKEDSHG